MKLQSLKVENFRCFESVSLDFEEDLNVIVGVNGSGKTAILDAIRFALCEVGLPPGMNGYAFGNQSIQHQYYSRFLSKDDAHIGKKALPFNREYVNFTCSAKVISRDWPVEWVQKTPLGTDPIPHSVELESIRAFMMELWNQVNRDPKTVISVPVYYPAYRRISKVPDLGNVLDVTFERQSAFYEALNAGINFQSACQWFYLRESTELRESTKRKDFDFEYHDLKAIRNALKNSIDGVERVFFDHSTPSRLKVAIGGTELALDQLSDGYRSQVAMIFDFARRLAIANPEMDNPLEAPGILLIDEIELHLHPKWQQTIIPSLRKAFPNTQLIVTTHSPQVLTSVESRCIRILKDNQITCIDEEIHGGEAKRALERILETKSRPPESPFGKSIEEVFRLINSDMLDEAESKLNAIDDRVKEYESTYLEAESALACRRWEKEAQS